MIRFDNVTKRYPNQSRPALDGIDLNIDRGEFVFVVGASGSGKSTLVRLTIREEVVSDGRLLVGGHDLRRMPQRKVPQLRRQVGTIFQDFRLLPNKTVQQNVAFALQVIGRPRRAIRALVPETLELVGLAGMEKRMPHELSGGEQQRVAIARAVVNKPPVLLADEPTGNLDPATSLDIVQLLRRIHEAGTTIVMATHDNTIVDALQKRVVELEDGLVIRDEEGGSYVPRAADSRDREERAAERTGDHAVDADPAEQETAEREGRAVPEPPEGRPLGEVHALDAWDDDAEDLLR